MHVWESLFLRVVATPLIENRNKIKLFRFSLIENKDKAQMSKFILLKLHNLQAMLCFLIDIGPVFKIFI